ncbi:MAG: lipoyl protein ligase domain-containing protein, partial [Hypericibacter sp.]
PPGVGRWRLQIERDPVSTAEWLRAEEALLDRVRNGEPSSCLIWQATRAIVLPRPLTDLPAFADAAAGMEARGWPVLPRLSGGTPVPQMPGVLNLSFVYPVASNLWSLEAAYRHLLAPLRLATRSFGLETDAGEVTGSLCAGRFDLAIGGRKFVGTAQRRRSGGRPGLSIILAHATLWIAPDLDRACAAVGDFLTVLGRPVDFRRETMTTLAAELGDSRPAEFLTGEFTNALLRVLDGAESPRR